MYCTVVLKYTTASPEAGQLTMLSKNCNGCCLLLGVTLASLVTFRNYLSLKVNNSRKRFYSNSRLRYLIRNSDIKPRLMEAVFQYDKKTAVLTKAKG